MISTTRTSIHCIFLLLQPFCSSGEDWKRPFPAEAEKGEEEVYGLEEGDGADGGVEVGGEEVPEEFGPEETFDAGEELVGGGGEDDEAGPVVFY